MNSNHILYFIFVLAILGFEKEARCQVITPSEIVKTEFTLEQTGDEAVILVSLKIKDDWRVIAANIPEDGSFLPMDILLAHSPNYSLIGTIVEPDPLIKSYDVIDEIIHFHTGNITIMQKLKVHAKGDFTINGFFSFQACTTGICLAPYEEEFVLNFTHEKTSE